MKIDFKKRINISTWKFILLNILTLGLYQFYWLFWTSYFLKTSNKSTVPLFFYLVGTLLVSPHLYSELDKLALKEKVLLEPKFKTWTMIHSAIIWLIILRGIEIYQIVLLCSSFLILIPLVQSINAYWRNKILVPNY